MAKYCIVAILVLIMIPIFDIGICYIREVKVALEQNSSKFNKQEYAKEKRNEFGISDKGSTMGECGIYVKNPSDFGL